ncbi:MAG TPA: DUF1521 domain-containing protein [Dokdonella sp.]
MSILGNLESLQFRSGINDALGRTDPSIGATRVRAALDGANPDNLSTQERNVLLSVTDTLSADGYISNADADVITGMIHNFESTGRFVDTLFGGNTGTLRAALESYSPSPLALAAQQFSAKPLFGGLLGYFVDAVAQRFQNALFLGSAQSMLGTCDGCANQQRVGNALADADLSKLSPRERSKVLAMIGFAAADGHISGVEANAITDVLDRAQGIRPRAQSQWTVQQDGGKAHIDLGNYTLDLDEGNSQFILTNKQTGEQTKVWGDPHMVVDGQAVGDFYGTTTLNLEDGTKITIHTTPYDAGNGMTLSSELVITQGDKAMVVQGLDQNTLGDLKIGQVASGGQFVDAVNDDGAEIYENPEGSGWLYLNSGGFLQTVDADFLKNVR